MHTVKEELQGQVRGNIFLPRPEFEFLCRVSSLQFHRDENERGIPHQGRVLGIDPLERTDRQEEDIDALLLFKRPSVVIEVEQLLLQPGGGETRLQPGVGMTIGDASRVHTVVFRLSEFGNFFDAILILDCFALAGNEGESLAIPHQQAEYLNPKLVNALQRLGALCGPRNAEQAIAS